MANEVNETKEGTIKLEDIAVAYWNFVQFEKQLKEVGVTVEDNSFYSKGADVLFDILTEAITDDEEGDPTSKLCRAEKSDSFDEFFKKICE